MTPNPTPTQPPAVVPEALLPCPFCNAAAHFESDADGWHWIECESCGMQGNRAASLMEDCRPKLREAWNTRAGVHPDVASGYAQGWEDGMSEATALSAAAPAVAPATDTTVLDAAMRAISQAIALMGEPEDERMRTVRRVLRGSVLVAEDAAPQAEQLGAPAAPMSAQPSNPYRPRAEHSWLARYWQAGFDGADCPPRTGPLALEAYEEGRRAAATAPTTEQAGAEKCPSCRNGDLYACTCPFPTSRNCAAPAAPTAALLEKAFRTGWAACRDAEYVGQEAEDEAWGASEINGLAIDIEQAGAPSADVQAKIESNTWDHFGDILPTLKAISRGDWYWGANSRCKYIEIRIDTRDGGCILYDRERVRISPAQFAFQAGGGFGKMDAWPAQNQVAAPGGEAPAPAPTAAPNALDEAALRVTADQLYQSFEIAGRVPGFNSPADLREFLGSAIVHYMAAQGQEGVAA